jgi:hypothetical protein
VGRFSETSEAFERRFLAPLHGRAPRARGALL